ncbi:MAG: DNA-binding protein HU-beta [Acidimicrobiia bacterium]|jgi:DNA-binding protein HU-beta|nr:DNA-binding protein HU-beta [Acidimicrobiia bacterium]
MNKTELVSALAERANLRKNEADEVLKAFVDVVTDELSSGDGEVTIPGFVSFKRVDRGAREARNPATGERIKLPASKAVKVSAGSKLKAAVK